MEASAQVVVHPALSHHIQRVGDHGQELGIPGSLVFTEEQLESYRWRELGRRAESSVGLIVAADHVPYRTVCQRPIQVRTPGRAASTLLDVSDPVCNRPGLLVHLIPPLRPGLSEGAQDLREAGNTHRVRRREVGTGVERLQIGREEHGVGPTPTSGHQLGGGHVDLVEVGALLAVDLDVDEPLVHQLGDLRVAEDLSLHHVAPVACGISHREEDRLVFLA